MSKVANITNFLNSQKVELSSEVVELALIDDLQKAMQIANKEASNATSGLSKAASAIEEVFTSYRQSAIYAKQVNDLYDQALVKAKDLGVDLPANAKAMNDDASNMVKSSTEKMKLLQTIKGQLK